jgi:hypothetical protein
LEKKGTEFLPQAAPGSSSQNLEWPLRVSQFHHTYAVLTGRVSIPSGIYMQCVSDRERCLTLRDVPIHVYGGLDPGGRAVQAHMLLECAVARHVMARPLPRKEPASKLTRLSMVMFVVNGV